MNRPMQRILSRFLVLVGLLALPIFSSADPPDQYKTYEIEPLQVVEEKPMTAASDQVVVDKNFLNLPRFAGPKRRSASTSSSSRSSTVIRTSRALPGLPVPGWETANPAW